MLMVNMLRLKIAARHHNTISFPPCCVFVWVYVGDYKQQLH